MMIIKTFVDSSFMKEKSSPDQALIFFSRPIRNTPLSVSNNT